MGMMPVPHFRIGETVTVHVTIVGEEGDVNRYTKATGKVVDIEPCHDQPRWSLVHVKFGHDCYHVMPGHRGVDSVGLPPIGPYQRSHRTFYAAALATALV